MLSPSVTRRLFDAYAARMGTADARAQRLTEREASVLHALAGGQSNTEIARSMHLSVETVKTHVKTY